MTEAKTCANGHRWNDPEETSATLVIDSTVCPFCSSPAVPADSKHPPLTADDGTLVMDPVRTRKTDTSAATVAFDEAENGPAVMREVSAEKVDGTIAIEPSLSGVGVTASDSTLALDEEPAPAREQSEGTVAIFASSADDHNGTLALDGSPAQVLDQGDRTLAVDDSPPQVNSDRTLAFESENAASASPDDTMALSREHAPPADDGTIQLSKLAASQPSEADGTVRITKEDSQAVSRPSPPIDGESGLPDIDGYQLLKELGRGGMGVVYKARQLGLNRIVALKMILAAGHASPQTLKRFRIEAEAVAQFQHPNIVQIYDVGEQDGKPYCALEFVDGGCLADKVEGIPQSPDSAAQMVAVLADAMDSAHRRGIIHRDLKPANIMLTSSGEPKITDFGLAKKFDEDSGQTREGAIMGTPSYMAPEQAEGKTKELGPAADIYSLGAILYDLTTGRPPFRGETLLATLQAVKNEEPVAPSRLLPKMPPDLETICLKCLNKDPKKRYLTAAALADDLRCFLNDEPIKARPVGATERVWKWTKRHPAVAGLIGTIAAVLVIAALVAVWVAITEAMLTEKALTAEHKAEEKEVEAEDAQKRSQKNFERATEAVDTMLSTVGQRTFAHEPRMANIRRTLLEAARRLWLQFLDEQSNDLGVKLQTAKAYKRLGDVEEMMGKRDEAAASYRQALDHLRNVVQEDPENYDARFALVSTEVALGKDLRDSGKPVEAKKMLLAALEEGNSLLQGAPAPDPRHRRAVSDAHNDLGLWYQEAKQSADAEKHYRASLLLLDQLAAMEPNEPSYRRDLGVRHGNLANYLFEQQQYDAARQEYEESLRVLGKLAADQKQDPDYRHELYRYQANFGVFLAATGNLVEAEKQLSEALDRDRELAHTFADRPDYNYDYGWVCRMIGSRLFLGGQPDKAEPYFRDSLKVLRDLVETFPGVPDYIVELSNAYAGLAETLQRDPGKRAEAADCHKQSLELRDSLSKRLPNVPLYQQLLATSYYGLALFKAKWEDERKDAESVMRDAIRLQRKLVREHNEEAAYKLELGRSYANLGTIQLQSNNTGRDPEKNFNLALETWQALPPSPGLERERAFARRNLAVLCTVNDKAKEACELYQLSIDALVKELASDPNNPQLLGDLAETCRFFAKAQLSRNDVLGAEKSTREGIRYRKLLLARTKQPADRTDMLELYYLLLKEIIVTREEDALKALDLVLEFAAVMPESYENRADVARLLTRCIPLAEKDQRLGDKRKETIVQCADEAVKLLRAAVAQGSIKNADQLKDADLNPLRDNAGFKKLQEELEKKTTQGSGP